MGKVTGIGWCDHTFNPWVGCKKISQGCAHCYAARENERFHWVSGWGDSYRGASENTWRNPVKWAKTAVADGVHRRVFCASLADVFDQGAPYYWRTRLWTTIEAAMAECRGDNGLEWLLLTKRPENIIKMLPEDWLKIPPAWIRIGVTVESQEYDHRIETLLGAWHGRNFVSGDPMLKVEGGILGVD